MLRDRPFSTRSQVNQFRFTEVPAGQFMNPIGDVSMCYFRHGLGPCQGSSFPVAEERRLAPSRHAYSRCSVSPQARTSLVVRVDAVGTILDLGTA